jgi:predicted Ser/Thr protein kinase
MDLPCAPWHCNTVACLSESEVLGFVGGSLPAEAHGLAAAHLDSCESCRQIVACVASNPQVSAVPERLGRYRVIREVGAGGMGTVYAAHDPDLGRVVALKLLRADAPAGLEYRARLGREAQAMARLAHPNVVAVHDIGTVGDQLFVAMERVEGGTLRAWMRASQRSFREIADVLCAAGRGLAAAHAAGVVHRDFKPDNVLVGTDGRVRVTDFGLARLAAAERQPEAAQPPPEDSPITLTLSGALLGTPAYMAPEALLGERVDERSDLFSFCTTFWEALYGERPYAGRNLAQLRAAVVDGALRPRPKDSGVPDAVHQALERGLCVDPSARWPSMNALLVAIEAGARPPAWSAKRRAGALLALLVMGAIGIAAWRGMRHPHAEWSARAGRRALAVLGIADAATGSRDGLLAGLLSERLAVELGAGEAIRLIPAEAVRRVGG